MIPASPGGGRHTLVSVPNDAQASPIIQMILKMPGPPVNPLCRWTPMESSRQLYEVHTPTPFYRGKNRGSKRIKQHKDQGWGWDLSPDPIRLESLFFFFFGHTRRHVGLFPDEGTNPCSLHWMCGVLTTGPPEKSFKSLFSLKAANHAAGLNLISSAVKWAEGQRSPPSEKTPHLVP